MNKKYLARLFVAIICLSLLTGCTANKTETDSQQTSKMADNDSFEDESILNNDSSNSNQPPDDQPEYQLVWSEDFSGTELNMENWNYETHEPGWVNNELQEYTDLLDNIYIEDGNLVIKALKTSEGGNNYYTSGKVTTKDKKEFSYGKFEIRAKMPKGKGLWPAIWMMPADEGFYGQWPKCGEIDIMEVLGHEPNVAYGTIHYGEPHREQQGKYVLQDDTLSDTYHVYSIEWEPSEIKFYIDGNLYHTVNDWFTKVEGKGEITYPAPFDQPFYLQLNLAVGGNWPGNPDETTDFEQAKLMVDYVKVYQKSIYDENVQKPVKDIELRHPDETGNYIMNGDFSDAEDLSDDVRWGQKYALEGVGNAVIHENQLKIETTNQGTVDYSIQIVQPDLPMIKGGEYKLTFDAFSDGERDMIVDISGPDNGYIRYFLDTVVALNTNSNSYEYTFTMKEESDANGRLEFNLGNRNSTASVYISNVRLEKTGDVAIEEQKKSALPDGNYIYNGEFQEGYGRMDYWEVMNIAPNAEVSVTNDKGRRELMVTAPEKIALSDILVVQKEIALNPNKNFVLSFDAYADQEKIIQIDIDEKMFEAELSNEKKQYQYKFSTTDVIENTTLAFALGTSGTTYIDNVRLAEDVMLINGDFISGFTGWTPFVDSSISSQVTYLVDSLTEEYAAGFEINDTGTQDWQIQLKQHTITLIEGKNYQLTFKAKTDMPNGRKIMAALQRDGSVDNDWTPYFDSLVVDLGTEYQTYQVTFQMNHATDENTILAFSMGAVGGEPIMERHTIYIDDVTLEEIEVE